MSSNKIFLLDSNVLMTAARHYYAFDIAPCFWTALNREAVHGKLRSIDRVRDEINCGNDELVLWINQSFLNYFFATDSLAVLQAYTDIMKWAQKQNRYSSAVKEDFARFNHADPWLVAYALAHRCVLVTLESADPATKKKIPIPIHWCPVVEKINGI